MDEGEHYTYQSDTKRKYIRFGVVSVVLVLIVIGILFSRSGKPVETPTPGVATGTPPYTATSTNVSSTTTGILDDGAVTLKGFRLELFAEGIEGASSIAVDSQGRLLVASASTGKIYAVSRVNGRTRIALAAERVDNPGGMFVYCEKYICYLYVAEAHAISRYEYVPDLQTLTDKKSLFFLTDDTVRDAHPMRLFTYKGKPTLFIGVGSQCDGCSGTQYTRKLLYAPLKSSALKVFAGGFHDIIAIAQSFDKEHVFVIDRGVKYDTYSVPDEFNYVSSGKFYGWPRCYGKNIYNRGVGPGYNRDPCLNEREQESVTDFRVGDIGGMESTPDEGWPQESRVSDFAIISMSDRVLAMEPGGSAKWIVKKWPLSSKGGRPTSIVKSGSTLYITDTAMGRVYTLTYNGPLDQSQQTEKATSTKATSTDTQKPFVRLGLDRLPACKVAGCSGELCVDETVSVDSICLFKPEYACLPKAKCERQPDTEKCGWTYTDTYKQCIADIQTE